MAQRVVGLTKQHKWNKNITRLTEGKTFVYLEALPGGGGGCPMSPVWNLKCLMSVFIKNACRFLLALPSLSQFGRERLSLVAISFYALSLLFGPCCLSEFTLAGPLFTNVVEDLNLRLWWTNPARADLNMGHPDCTSNTIRSDQFRFLGNSPPTPPLSHHFALSEK